MGEKWGTEDVLFLVIVLSYTFCCLFCILYHSFDSGYFITTRAHASGLEFLYYEFFSSWINSFFQCFSPLLFLRLVIFRNLGSILQTASNQRIRIILAH